MSSWLSRLFKSSRAPRDGFTQPQREALIDLLNLGMSADGKFRLSEERILDAEVARLDWQSEVSVAEFAAGSLERAIAARERPETTQALIASINDRLATPALRARALALCRQLFVSDGEFAASELALFESLAKTVGWNEGSARADRS